MQVVVKFLNVVNIFVFLLQLGPMKSARYKQWWKFVLRVSRSCSNLPGPPKTTGAPLPKDNTLFENIQKIITTTFSFSGLLQADLDENLSEWRPSVSLPFYQVFPRKSQGNTKKTIRRTSKQKIDQILTYAQTLILVTFLLVNFIRLFITTRTAAIRSGRALDTA